MKKKLIVPASAAAPLISLRPPQRRVFRHKSGILFFIWRRQCGKSYCLAIQALDKMMSKAGVSVIFMSASLRLGQENILKEATVWRDVLARMKAPISEAGLNLTTNIEGLGIDDVAELFEKQKLNDEMLRRRDSRIDAWNTLWCHPDAKPADIIAALGTDAGKIFAASAEDARHQAAVAEIAGGTLADIGLADYVTPPGRITVHPDGTASLA